MFGSNPLPRETEPFGGAKGTTAVPLDSGALSFGSSRTPTRGTAGAPSGAGEQKGRSSRLSLSLLQEAVVDGKKEEEGRGTELARRRGGGRRLRRPAAVLTLAERSVGGERKKNGARV